MLRGAEVQTCTRIETIYLCMSRTGENRLEGMGTVGISMSVGSVSLSSTNTEQKTLSTQNNSSPILSVCRFSFCHLIH